MELLTDPRIIQMLLVSLKYNFTYCGSMCVCLSVCLEHLSILLYLLLIAGKILDTAAKLKDSGMLIKVAVGDKQQLVAIFRCILY